MSHLAKIIANAQQAVTKLAGVDITYKRGATFVKLRALKLAQHFTEDELNQMYTDYRAVDFKFPVTDLKLNDLLVEPQPGDTIEEQIGNKTVSYKVSRPGNASDQPWSFDSTYRTHYRVHAMEVGEANV